MAEPPIRVRERTACYLCGRTGESFKAGLRDRVSGVPGEWSSRACRSCGLAWLDPQPVPEELHRLYVSYYTHEAGDGGARMAGPRERFARAVLADALGYPAPDDAGAVEVLARLAGVLRPVRESVAINVMGLAAAQRGELLDVGCGSGDFLVRMRELGWRVRGFETDPVAAEVARERRGLDVRTGTLESAGFPEGHFEAVTLHHVIEHLPDPLATLAYCRRLLKPGGLLAVVTPNTRSLGCRVFGRSWLHWDAPRHLILFSPAALEALVRRAGFRIRSVSTPERQARWSFGASWRIRRAGSFPDAVPAKLTWTERLGGLGFQVLESMFPARARLGEEILLLAAADSRE